MIPHPSVMRHEGRVGVVLSVFFTTTLPVNGCCVVVHIPVFPVPFVGCLAGLLLVSSVLFPCLLISPW